jgi:soluble lytic murein transglycosylase-like protein
MTRTEKILIGAVATGVVYYIFTRSSAAAPGSPTVKVSQADAERVMSYAGLIMMYGLEQGVYPALVASVMTVESRGKADAVGSSGEIGLMQIMPSTAKWIANVGIESLALPATNIQTGTAYLRYCIDRKGGNGPAGVAAYNYGPDRVVVTDGMLNVPDSVKRYVQNVLSLIESYQDAFRLVTGGTYTPPKTFTLGSSPCAVCES